jgi:hypothetical protein
MPRNGEKFCAMSRGAVMCGPLPPGFTPPGAPVRTTPSAGLPGRRGELKLNVIRETIYRRLTRVPAAARACATRFLEIAKFERPLRFRNSLDTCRAQMISTLRLVPTDARRPAPPRLSESHLWRCARRDEGFQRVPIRRCIRRAPPLAARPVAATLPHT